MTEKTSSAILTTRYKVGSITIESHESTNVTVVAVDFKFCFAIIINNFISSKQNFDFQPFGQYLISVAIKI
jgi:hypothetical protein